MTEIKTAEKIENLTEKELDKVSGGWKTGSDRFFQKDYEKAGVTWTSNWFSADTYTIIDNGQEKNITQAEAENIAANYHGRYSSPGKPNSSSRGPGGRRG